MRADVLSPLHLLAEPKLCCSLFPLGHHTVDKSDGTYFPNEI